MTIRLAQDHEAAVVTECVHAAFSKWIEVIGRKPRPMEADFATLIAQKFVYVLSENQKILGIIALWPQENTIYIDTVAVFPEWQKHGIGRQLLDFAESHAQSLGIPTLSLCTNEKMQSNRAYYLKLGYSQVNLEKLPDGGAVVWMEKSLTAPA